jgi:hypothetical protein
VKPELAGHVSRDATAIQGREKPTPKSRREPPAPRKKGRPRRGEKRAAGAETRLARQCRQSAAALEELPVYCDVGTKKNVKGYKETWIGYKLHADVNDWGAPISVALTAASVHDSQVAIPLMKLSSDRVDYLYDPMDAAYDTKEIDADRQFLCILPEARWTPNMDTREFSKGRKVGQLPGITGGGIQIRTGE